MKFILLIIVLVIITLLFIKFDKPIQEHENSIKKEVINQVDRQGSVKKNVTSKDSDYDNPKTQIPEKQGNNNDNNDKQTKYKKPDQENKTANEKFVFQRYDREANAQAFINHLYAEKVSFEVLFENKDGGFNIFFEFHDKQEKKKKLEEITQITGMKF